MATSYRVLVGSPDLGILFLHDVVTVADIISDHQHPSRFPACYQPRNPCGCRDSGLHPRIEPVLRGTVRTKGGMIGAISSTVFLLMSVENTVSLCHGKIGTREGLSNSFFPRLTSIRGKLMAERGDPFYVNYVGHPCMARLSGYHLDAKTTAYRDIQFGQNRRYWKGKLRGRSVFVYL